MVIRYTKMTKQDLKDYADSLNIKVSMRNKRSEIIKKIKASKAEATKKSKAVAKSATPSSKNTKTVASNNTKTVAATTTTKINSDSKEKNTDTIIATLLVIILLAIAVVLAI